MLSAGRETSERLGATTAAAGRVRLRVRAPARSSVAVRLEGGRHALDPTGERREAARLAVCSQNHDQVGNLAGRDDPAVAAAVRRGGVRLRADLAWLEAELRR